MSRKNGIPIEERPEGSFASESDLANHWDLSGRTLQRWRNLGEGPPFSIIGGSVRYRVKDILDYERRYRREAGE